MRPNHWGNEWRREEEESSFVWGRSASTSFVSCQKNAVLQSLKSLSRGVNPAGLASESLLINLSAPEPGLDPVQRSNPQVQHRRRRQNLQHQPLHPPGIRVQAQTSIWSEFDLTAWKINEGEHEARLHLSLLVFQQTLKYWRFPPINLFFLYFIYYTENKVTPAPLSSSWVDDFSTNWGWNTKICLII